jgi:hypothetical protein
VVGNKYGLFYNSKPASPLLEIDALIKKWDKVFVVMDALGDTSLVQTIKDKHKNVFISYYRGDVSSQNLIKWGDSNEYGTVHIAKNQTLQQIIEEIKAKSLEFSGTYEDWEQVIQQFINLYKITEPESYSWESSGPDGFVKALINFRVGLDRFSSTSATVVSSGGLDSLPVGRIFIDD